MGAFFCEILVLPELLHVGVASHWQYTISAMLLTASPEEIII